MIVICPLHARPYGLIHSANLAALLSLILPAWGAGVVGTVDSVLCPLVIDENARFHPLRVFFALFGGVEASGVNGHLVGPAMLALTTSLFSLVREETHTQIDKTALSSRIASEQLLTDGN